MRLSTIALGLLAALVAPAAAQTFTDCNPMNKTCPENPALGTNHTWNLGNSTFDTDSWKELARSIDYENGQSNFVITKAGESAAVQSTFYIFWGSVSVVTKASKGRGIISSIMLQSDDLDEIDWEWIGNNNTHVQTNYFGKGNTGNFDRMIAAPVSNPQDEFHNYTTVWSEKQLEWWIDDNKVRVLTYEKSEGAGKFYPQTPVHVNVGIWPAGDSDQPGMVEWAGGKPDYAEEPFTMGVRSVFVQDGTKDASSYAYSDNSGSFESITVNKGTSTVAEILNRPPPESVSEKFNKLSPGAKIGIGASVGAVLLALLVLFFICCCRRRKQGRLERQVEDANWDKTNAELMAYRTKMANGSFAQGSGPKSPNPGFAPVPEKYF